MDNAEKLKQEFDEFHRIRMQYAHLIAKKNIGIGWPFGWNDIVRRIFEYCEENKYKIAVVQVKEKFGGLRFYYDRVRESGSRIYYDRVGESGSCIYAANPEFDQHDMQISRLEGESFGVCEICGEPGESRRLNGWIATRCIQHANTKKDFYSDASGLRYDEADQEFYIRLKSVGAVR